MWIYMKLLLIIIVSRVVNVVTSRNSSSVQCSHLATLINTSFQVFTFGISHFFPFNDQYSGVKLWPWKCGWGSLSPGEPCRENIQKIGGARGPANRTGCSSSWHLWLNTKNECGICCTTSISNATHIIMISNIHLKYMLIKHTYQVIQPLITFHY